MNDKDIHKLFFKSRLRYYREGVFHLLSQWSSTVQLSILPEFLLHSADRRNEHVSLTRRCIQDFEPLACKDPDVMKIENCIDPVHPLVLPAFELGKIHLVRIFLLHVFCLRFCFSCASAPPPDPCLFLSELSSESYVNFNFQSASGALWLCFLRLFSFYSKLSIVLFQRVVFAFFQENMFWILFHTLASTGFLFRA